MEGTGSNKSLHLTPDVPAHDFAGPRPKAGRSGSVENGTALHSICKPQIRKSWDAGHTLYGLSVGLKRTLTINNLQYEVKPCCKNTFLSPKGSILPRRKMMQWEAFIPDPPHKPDEAENILFVYLCSFLKIFWIPVSRHVQC